MTNNLRKEDNSLNELDVYLTLKRLIPKEAGWVVIHSSLIHLDLKDYDLKWNFLSAIKKLVNEGYTFALPSFTFSFTESGKFDPIYSLSETGLLADWVFQLNDAIRTKHPIYSHIVVGPEAYEALDASLNTCFGKESIFSIFDRKNSCIVMLGCGWQYCTSFHYFEELKQVPYRYYKKFYYDESEVYTEMYVRDLEKKVKNNFSSAIDELKANSLIESYLFNDRLVESCTFNDLAEVCNRLLDQDDCIFTEDSRLLKKLLNDDEEAKKTSLNVGFFGSSNLDLLVNKFKNSSKDLIPGYNIKCFSSEFGQMFSDLAGNKLKKLSLDFSFLPERLEDIYQVATIDLIDHSNLEPLERYLNFIAQIGKINSRSVFVSEFSINSEQVNGPVFIEGIESPVDFVKKANILLRSEIDKHNNIFLISPEAMLGGVFESDPRLWYLGRIPFSEIVTTKIVQSYCSFICNDIGRTARLIILDLDNTLWGGVLGEDGIKGLRIGGDFPGNAFKDFQATILKLKARGIALAIVSKNDKDLALKALKEHPEILIKESDLASYKINWNEKYQNIIEICNDLSLGLGSVLFVDDNPVERQKVKVNLPEVNVLELPEDPSLYRKSLLSHVSLGLANISSEDLKRSDNYIKRKELKNIETSFKNINDFYKSLEIKIAIQELNDGNFSRALQMISKTNQFNTTTIRYNNHEIVEISKSPEKIIKVIGYEDKMSDYENIGLFVLRKEEKRLIIENFLLSCRILERGVEQAALSWIYEYAKSEAIEIIVGEIVVTPRNTPAQSFYKKNEFMFDKVSSNWRRSLEKKITLPDWTELTEEREY